MVDIRLDENWKLTQAATGDAPTAADIECILQDIRLESLTQEGGSVLRQGVWLVTV